MVKKLTWGRFCWQWYEIYWLLTVCWNCLFWLQLNCIWYDSEWIMGVWGIDDHWPRARANYFLCSQTANCPRKQMRRQGHVTPLTRTSSPQETASTPTSWFTCSIRAEGEISWENMTVGQKLYLVWKKVHFVLRAVYQMMVWNDIRQQLNVPSPDGHGWKETNGELDILWHLKFCSTTRSQGKRFGKCYHVIYSTLQDERYTPTRNFIYQPGSDWSNSCN